MLRKLLFILLLLLISTTLFAALNATLSTHPTSLSLTWDSVDGATFYDIYNGNDFIVRLDGSERSYTIKDLDSEKSYSIALAVRDSANNTLESLWLDGITTSWDGVYLWLNKTNHDRDGRIKEIRVLEDISFTVKKGEIFGLYGLVGAGRSELLESLFGVRTIASGDILVNGKRLTFNSSKDAMDNNFALVTEERKVNGMFGKGNLEFNTCITNMKAYKTNGIVSNRKMYDATKRQIEQMKTKCVSTTELITALSGGNQQKVIIGKWMERRPDVFLMDEPTRGIDVGAKYEIYQLIIRMAKEGKTVIVVSSEMPEILGITNRIAVMSNHRLSGIVETKKTNQEELLRLSAKYL